MIIHTVLMAPVSKILFNLNVLASTKYPRMLLHISSSLSVKHTCLQWVPVHAVVITSENMPQFTPSRIGQGRLLRHAG